MATKNITRKDLLLSIAALLDEFPDLHEQESWESTCGTKACIAGWACILGTDDFKLKGTKWVPKKRTLIEHEIVFDAEEIPKDPEARIEMLTGYEDYFMETGRRLLDLDEDEANHLFAAWHGPTDGLTVADALAAIAKGASVYDVWGHPNA